MQPEILEKRCGTGLLQKLPILHYHHEWRGSVGNRSAFEVEYVVNLRHQLWRNRTGHGQRDIPPLLFDVVLAGCNVDFSRAGHFEDVAFHLQGHVLYYAPNLVLIFRSTGCQYQLPLSKAQLLDLIGSLTVDDVVGLLRRSWRYIHRDLGTPIRGWTRSSFCRGQGILVPALG